MIAGLGGACLKREGLAASMLSDSLFLWNVECDEDVGCECYPPGMDCTAGWFCSFSIWETFPIHSEDNFPNLISTCSSFVDLSTRKTVWGVLYFQFSSSFIQQTLSYNPFTVK